MAYSTNRRFNSYGRRSKNSRFSWIFFLFVIFFVAATAFNIYALTVSETVADARVTKTERVITHGNGSNIVSKYLIFTDKEVFSNTDSLFYWKFNSSDFYARINQGDVCTFKVVGFRIPFLSRYRNVIEADCGA